MFVFILLFNLRCLYLTPFSCTFQIRSKGEAKPMGLFSRRRVQLMSGALLGTSVEDINDDDKYEKSKYYHKARQGAKIHMQL